MLIALHADLRCHLGDVDGELVRVGKHASLMAGAAIVAEVRQITNVIFVKAFADLERREKGTQALAIATRIANG